MVKKYRYVRFVPTALRGGWGNWWAGYVRLSRLAFTGRDISIKSCWLQGGEIKDHPRSEGGRIYPRSEGEGVSECYKGQVCQSSGRPGPLYQWLDRAKGMLIFQFTQEVAIESYSYVTATNHSSDSSHDPVSWLLEGSNDDEHVKDDERVWELLDKRVDVKVDKERGASVGSFNLQMHPLKPQENILKPLITKVEEIKGQGKQAEFMENFLSLGKAVYERFRTNEEEISAPSASPPADAAASASTSESSRENSSVEMIKAKIEAKIKGISFKDLPPDHRKNIFAFGVVAGLDFNTLEGIVGFEDSWLGENFSYSVSSDRAVEGHYNLNLIVLSVLFNNASFLSTLLSEDKVGSDLLLKLVQGGDHVLHLAIKWNREEIVIHLINAFTRNNIPLDTIAMRWLFDNKKAEVLRTVVKSEKFDWMKEYDGDSLLHLLVESIYRAPKDAGRVELIETLITNLVLSLRQRGLTPSETKEKLDSFLNIKDKATQRTPLDLAVQKEKQTNAAGQGRAVAALWFNGARGDDKLYFNGSRQETLLDSLGFKWLDLIQEKILMLRLSLYDKSRELENTQAEQSRLINQHSEEIDQHSEKIDQHSEKIDQLQLAVMMMLSCFDSNMESSDNRQQPRLPLSSGMARNSFLSEKSQRPSEAMGDQSPESEASASASASNRM